MAVTALAIIEAGELLLAVIQEQMAEQTVDLPARVGMIPGGMFIEDGPGLTVMFSGLHFGPPGQAQSTGPIWPAAIRQTLLWEVTLIRSVHGLTSGSAGRAKAPTPKQLTGDFETIVADAQALWAAMVTIHAAGTIVPIGLPFIYGPVGTVGPEGDLAGVRCPVSWEATS